jgi:hypothetical protein
MIGFLSQVARAVARVFAPTGSDLSEVGYQPITHDVFRCKGSACYASDFDQWKR